MAQHIPMHNPPGNDDTRTFSVRLIAHGYRDQYQDVQSGLVYDPDADLFARLTGHTRSGAMSQAERDYTVRDVGAQFTVVDAWDIELHDVDAEEQQAYVAEWLEIVMDEARYGEVLEDIRRLGNKTVVLRDYDNRHAKIQYELVDGN